MDGRVQSLKTWFSHAYEELRTRPVATLQLGCAVVASLTSSIFLCFNIFVLMNLRPVNLVDFYDSLELAQLPSQVWGPGAGALRVLALTSSSPVQEAGF